MHRPKDDRLAEIKERVERATAGEWSSYPVDDVAHLLSRLEAAERERDDLRYRMDEAKRPAHIQTSSLYYAQKDGCKQHPVGVGKICYGCVDETLAAMESRCTQLESALRLADSVICWCHPYVVSADHLAAFSPDALETVIAEARKKIAALTPPPLAAAPDAGGMGPSAAEGDTRNSAVVKGERDATNR